MISQQKDELEILNQQLAGTVDKRNFELKNVNERLRTTSLELIISFTSLPMILKAQSFG